MLQKILQYLTGSSSNDDLKTILNENPFLVDVRSPTEFKAGSAKGAVNIPLDTIQNHLSKMKNKKHIVVFCKSGIRANQAKSILIKNGFTNVTSGGTWQNVNQFVNN
jgi:rhodanese-related sulfurtransferase